MSKNPPLTPEERELFRNSVKINHPVRQDKLPAPSPPVKKRKPATPINRTTPPPMGISQSFLEKLSPEDWLTAEDYIHFARTGIPLRTLNKLKRGLLPIEARIDLHRLRGDEMLQVVEAFLQRCLVQGQRHVLIVHGKGSNETNKPPVLKNVLNLWLRQHTAVLAFCSAKPRDGGSGTLYILLKSRK